MSNDAGAAGNIDQEYGGTPSKVVGVVDQPVERRNRHLDTDFTADINPDGPSGITRRRQHRAASIPDGRPGAFGPQLHPTL